MPNLFRFLGPYEGCIAESAKDESALRILTANFRISQDSALAGCASSKELVHKSDTPSLFIKGRLCDCCLRKSCVKKGRMSSYTNIFRGTYIAFHLWSVPCDQTAIKKFRGTYCGRDSLLCVINGNNSCEGDEF